MQVLKQEIPLKCCLIWMRMGLNYIILDFSANITVQIDLQTSVQQPFSN